MYAFVYQYWIMIEVKAKTIKILVALTVKRIKIGFAARLEQRPFVFWYK